MFYGEFPKAVFHIKKKKNIEIFGIFKQFSRFLKKITKNNRIAIF
jgi:hypothetical protein